MGNLIETATWEAGVPYFEADAVLTGGPDCPDNIPIQALANRTAFLKKKIDDAVSGALTIEYANRLKTARTITMTGDGTWSVTFDGSGNAAAEMTLANTGVAAGSYTKLTVDAKGRITAATSLTAVDIPVLDWSKITTGKPTTLAGYGITDAAGTNHHHSQSTGVGTAAPSAYSHGGTNVVVEVKNAASTVNAQAHCILTSGADLAGSAIGTVTWVNPRGMLSYWSVRTGNSYDGSSAATRHVETDLRVMRAGVAVSRYRVAESGNQIWNSADADDGTPFQFYGAVRADSPAASADNQLLAPTSWVRALLAASCLGNGQTVQDVKASRSPGTTYYNTTGRPIFVNVLMTSTAQASARLTVNGIAQDGSSSTGANNGLYIAGIIPPGGSYSVGVSSGTATINQFYELR